MRPSAEQLDEGYSDELHSPPSGGESSMLLEHDDDPEIRDITERLLDLDVLKRLRLVKDILPSFSIPDLFELHRRIGSLVYFDPVKYLPNELILHIFSHLRPSDLLAASLVSRSWRERTNDERLWHDCFGQEGWKLDRARFSRLEELARSKGVAQTERLMRNMTPGSTFLRRGSRKRPRDEAFSEGEGGQVQYEMEQKQADQSDSDESMNGVQTAASDRKSVPANPRESLDNSFSASDTLMDFSSPRSSIDSAAHFDSIPPSNPAELTLAPPVFTNTKDPKISWPYLYKQRRRLEKNWDNGKYTMFRLPHPNHEDEGHSECVYTIQFTGQWLVSGSRDRSIRIWDLDTCRLKQPPLHGHDASVLCLQFDARDDQDIIVSGGSDTFVIIWKFSTGEIVRKMTDAHSESVLNLRFDDRYLITCSKDKTIKIWNRYEISKNDRIIPARMLSKFEGLESLTIQPWTLLDTFTGHHAAVNAVQIHGDVIVSASGDRTIRAWDIHTGTSRKQYTGHTKGIACVQYDGRRVVSGSSDNTVRIFDYETQAEIAWLEGHTNLVRTVQARFGDLDTVSDEELVAQSRLADRNFRTALDRGMRLRRDQPRNAGSSRPEDMSSFGSRMPPGGGGSPWAKIVSGSYDETIIIWKRDKDGKWKANQRLQQGALLSQPNLARHMRATTGIQLGNQNMAHAQSLIPTHYQTQATQNLLHVAQNQLLQINTMLQQVTPHNHGPPTSNAQITAMTTAQQSLNQQMQVLASQQHQQALIQGHAAMPTQVNHAPAPASTQQTAQGGGQQPALGTQPGNNGNNPAGNNQLAQNPQGQSAQAAQAVVGHHHHHHHHHAHHHHHQPGAPSPRDTNRVFKLQFDARRIVTCSQNKVIVGWDFAAGDKDLEWIGDWSIETA